MFFVVMHHLSYIDNFGFYAPAMKWPGAYSVTLRHSVILSFRHSINGFRSLSLEWLHTFLKFKFGIWIHHRIMQVKFEFGHGQMIF
jgi:hypothetical protein